MRVGGKMRPWTRLCGALALASLSIVLAAFAQAANLYITQRGIRFSQTDVTVKVGDRIQYQNEDDVTHNLMVTGPDGDPENQGLQKPGATVSKTFTSEGTFEVRCAIHPRMKMIVTVTR